MSAKSSKQLSLIDLFNVGAHRGNKKSVVNPQLKPYIYGNKDGLSLIDLAQTKALIEQVEEFLSNLGSKQRQILVVGTSEHVRELTKEYALKFSDKTPYVNFRWLGGTLTNWPTVRKTLKKLEKNEKIISDEKFMSDLSRNEKLSIQRETNALKRVFDGLKTLKSNRPSAIIVLDTANNKVAVQEAENMGIPVISLTNTSTKFLPKDNKFTIVCNNNSTNLVKLVMDRFVVAYNAGLSLEVETNNETK